jgi:hypothetical protein
MNDSEIYFPGIWPLVLQAKLRLFVFREDEYPRSLAIEPVHNKNPIPRFRNTLADVVGENEVSRARFLPIRADGQ